MSRGRQKKRAAGGAREAAASLKTIETKQSVTDATHDAAARSSGPKWPLWLTGKASGQERDEAISETAPVADARTGLSDRPADTAHLTAVGNSENKTEELASPLRDESKNARPLSAGVMNDATDMRKENQMQTATQINPISESDIATKIDLRDRKSVKEVNVQDGLKSASTGMASLFGPIIEDEVKGVRSQIREMIQSELQGELGQRFSRNLRIVIRREIAAAVDDQFDRV